MKYVWRHIPLFRFLLPVMLGILCSTQFSIHIIALLIVACILSVSSIGLHIYTRKHVNRSVIHLNSVFVIVLLFLGGVVLYNVNNELLSDKHFSKAKGTEGYVVRIASNPTIKPKSVMAEVQILEAFDSSDGKPCIGRAQVFFEIDSSSLAINYGDVLLVSDVLKPIAPPANPHQFDFRRYYASKNIFHNGYVPQDQWTNTGENKGKKLFAFAFLVQERLTEKFASHISDAKVRGVAEAIVFGYKEELDEEWLEAFSKTGTIHVLAVSGLHVGIIYVLLAFALQIKRSKGKWLIIKAVIILVVLFFYSLITGFSPSVSRASIMFGLVLLATVFTQKANIYNSLSFACLVLLVVNTNNLFNVGFQFSFLAVFGIIFYQDGIKRLFPTSNWLMDKVITLAAVSIAAQITTFPLGLYYFHQFPNLFVFSNLLVIPCITIILYGGIFFVLTSYISTAVAAGFAAVISTYIQFISKSVIYIKHLPFAFFENVYISFWQMVFIYLFILALSIAWKNRWKPGLALAMLSVMLFVASDFLRFHNTNKTEVISFYHPKETLLAFRKNEEVIFFASNGIVANDQAFKYIITPYLVKEGLVQDYDILPIETLKRPFSKGAVLGFGNGTIWFNNKSYLVLDEVKDYIGQPITVDFMILGNKKSTNYCQKVASQLPAKNVLIMPNTSFYLKNVVKDKKFFSSKKTSFIIQDNTYIKL